MAASSTSMSNRRMQRLARYFDYFFMLRPTLMFPLWTMVLIGYGLAPSVEPLTPLRWLLVTISLSSLFGLVYLLNQMKDREGDKVNGKLMLVAGEIVSRLRQRVIAALLVVLSTSALLASGFAGLGLWMAGVFAMAGLLYNYSPIALERSPWGGILSGLLGGWLLLRLGGKFAGSEIGWLVEAPYVLAFTAGCILTALPDVKGDIVSGKRTLAVVYGEKFTMGFAALLVAMTGVLAAFLSQWALSAAAFAGGILIFWGWISGSSYYAVLGNKISMFILALGVGIYFPWFFVAILIYYPFARWYHKARFSLDYPGFTVNRP